MFNWRLFQGIYTAIAPLIGDGRPGTVRIGNDSILLARLVGPSPFTTSLVKPTTGLVQQATWKASAGTMRLFSGRVMTAANRWVMLFNSAGVVANGAVPLLPSISCTPALPLGFPMFLTFADLPFAAGITVAISTTPETLTLPGVGVNELTMGGIYT